MSDEIETGPRVIDAMAKDFITLVEQGASESNAAKMLGTTVSSLRKSGALGLAVRERLERVKTENLLGKETEETVARVRRLELMLQDDDVRVAASMVRSVLDKGPDVAVTINNQNALLADPAVRESLKALQIDLEPESKNE